MDVGAATIKITDITLTVNEYYTKIKTVYNNIAKKINGYIDELDKLIDKLTNATTQAIAWIEMQINKVIKKILDALSFVQAKIDSIIKQVEAWYDKTITKIKISVIKSAMAKIGVSLSNSEAESLSSIIPHPDIKTLIPKINIELEIPDIAGMIETSEIDIDIEKYLKKLPLL